MKKFGLASLGIPISLSFCFAVIGVAIGNRFLNDYLSETAPNKKPSVYIMQVPTILYVGSVIVLDTIYSSLSKLIVEKENHRDD